MIDLNKDNTSNYPNRKWKISLLLLIAIILSLFIAVKSCSNIVREKRIQDSILPELVPEKEDSEPILNRADEGRDSTVSLQFLGFTLNEKIKSNRLSSITTVSWKELSTIKGIAKLTVNKKQYMVNLCIQTVNDTVASIQGIILTDIYKELEDIYWAKYGTPNFNSWNYKNQCISLIEHRPQRVIWHPELKKNIYTNHYDFKDIVITYTDYSFEDRIKILQEEEKQYSKRQQAIKDSIENERIEKARKEEEDKKMQLLSTEGAQI